MAKTTQWLMAYPPKGGLNLAVNPLLQNMDSLTQADDIVFSTDLRRAQRPGQVAFAGTNGNLSLEFPHVRNIYDFWYRSGSTMTNRVIKINGPYVNADAQGDGDFNNITGTTALGGNDRVTLETFANQLLLCSETAVPQSYSGTGVLTDLSGTPPNGSLVRKHMNRLWIAGVKAAPHTLYYSQAFTAATWSGTGTGSLEIDPDDGDPVGITAIFPSFFGELYVAKRNSIYQIVGTTPSTFQVIPLVTGLGSVEHNSVARVNNDILFASDRGVHSLVATRRGTGVETEYVSFPIQPLWASDMNLTSARRLYGTWLRQYNSYLLLYPGGSATSAYCTGALGFNAALQQWFTWPNFAASSITELYAGSKTRVLVGRNDGRVSELKQSALSDLGGEIRPAITIGPFFPSGAPWQDIGYKNQVTTFASPQRAPLKIVYKVENFQSKTKTLTPSATGVLLGDTFIMGTDALGAGASVSTESVPLEGVGTSYSVQMLKDPAGTVLGEEFIMGTETMENAETKVDIYGFGIEIAGLSDTLEERGIN